MRDIVMPTYGDLDRKTLLEDINGKISVQTDETITRTADGKLSIPGGGSGYNLPPATETTLGGVMPDGVTTVVDANGVLTAIGGGMQGESYTKAESDAKFVDVAGDQMLGDLDVRGYVQSSRDDGVAHNSGAVGVKNTTGTDGMYLSINDTEMNLYQKNSVGEGSIIKVDRASGEITSDVFESKGVVSGIVQLLTTENLNDLPFDSTKSYRQIANNLATPENNYPVGMAGYLEVLHGDQNIAFQRYTALNGLAPPYMYIRQYYDDEFSEGGWSEWIPVISGMGGTINNHSLYIVQTSGANAFQIGGNDDHIKMHMGDGSFGIFQGANNIYDDIISTYRDTGVIGTTVFVLATSVFMRNLNAYSPEELSLHQEEIEDKILELELKLERAQSKGFVKSIATIQSQLQILNDKLAEVI